MTGILGALKHTHSRTRTHTFTFMLTVVLHTHTPGPWNPSSQHPSVPVHRHLPSLCTQTPSSPGEALSWGFLLQNSHLIAQRQLGSVLLSWDYSEQISLAKNPERGSSPCLDPSSRILATPFVLSLGFLLHEVKGFAIVSKTWQNI